MYEKKGDKLLTWPRFLRRLALSALVASGIVVLAMAAGVAGYHCIAGLNWVDAILNASMILAGMGPVDTMQGTASKLFASAYALFSGVVFLSAVAVVVAPIFHRVLHKFHLDSDT
jgi:hypothetical protein